MVALPKIAAAQAGTDAEERVVVRNWMLASLVLLVPTTLVFEAVTPVAIPFLFGDDFSDAIPCGYWYVAASGFLSFRRVLIAILQGRGRGHLASWVEFVLTPVLILVIWLASRTGDLETAGIGMLVVSVLACVSLGVCVLRAPRVGWGATTAADPRTTDRALPREDEAVPVADASS
jgi:O-antigen/teichoic acid export membrane protein